MSAKNVPISSAPSVVVTSCASAASWPAAAEAVELESMVLSESRESGAGEPESGSGEGLGGMNLKIDSRWGLTAWSLWIRIDKGALARDGGG